MKKTLATLALAAAMAAATPSRAASYFVFVAGVTVTDENKDNITSPDITGHVSYDPATKTLTLDNASIAPTGATPGIKSQEPGLTIELLGHNVVHGDAHNPILFNADGVIRGPGSLEAVGKNYSGIYIELASLRVEDATVTARGETYGICGRYGEVETLTLVNSWFTARGAANGSIVDILSMQMQDCHIARPAGSYFDPVFKGVILNGAVVTDEVAIEPDNVSYPLWLAGQQVTSANLADVLGDGTAAYDPAGKRLALSSASISAAGQPALRSQVDGLTIALEGDNALSSDVDAAVVLEPTGAAEPAGATIEGAAVLRLSGAQGARFAGVQLTVAGAMLVADATGVALGGAPGSRGTLALRQATVRATGAGGSVADIDNLSLDGCHIAAPAGAAFDAALGAVAAGGAVVTGLVEILPGAPTGVGAAHGDARLVAVAHGGRIAVDRSADLPVAVYNAAGQQVASAPAGAPALFDLARGQIYLIRAGGQSTKVANL